MVHTFRHLLLMLASVQEFRAARARAAAGAPDSNNIQTPAGVHTDAAGPPAWTRHAASTPPLRPMGHNMPVMQDAATSPGRPACSQECDVHHGMGDDEHDGQAADGAHADEPPRHPHAEKVKAAGAPGDGAAAAEGLHASVPMIEIPSSLPDTHSCPGRRQHSPEIQGFTDAGHAGHAHGPHAPPPASVLKSQCEPSQPSQHAHRGSTAAGRPGSQSDGEADPQANQQEPNSNNDQQQQSTEQPQTEQQAGSAAAEEGPEPVPVQETQMPPPGQTHGSHGRHAGQQHGKPQATGPSAWTVGGPPPARHYRPEMGRMPGAGGRGGTARAAATSREKSQVRTPPCVTHHE